MRLLSIDTLKTGGVGHLKSLADALGVGMKVAEDPRELAALVAGSMGDISIIDSSGINPFDSVDADHLAEFIDQVDAEPVLVLPAGLDRVDAVETAHAFARLKCRRMIVTRVDMTRRLGSVLDAPTRPISPSPTCRSPRKSWAATAADWELSTRSLWRG